MTAKNASTAAHSATATAQNAGAAAELQLAHGHGMVTREIALIILASGFSRRFGREKLMHDFEGKPLLQYALEAGLTYPFHKRVLVSRLEEAQRLGEAFGYAVIDNPHAHEGQSASVRLGVAACEDCGAYVFLPGDQPRVRAETLAKLAGALASGEYDAACAVFNGEKVSPTAISAVHKAALLAISGDKGGKGVLLGAGRVFEWEIDACEAMDVDRPHI